MTPSQRIGRIRGHHLARAIRDAEYLGPWVITQVGDPFAPIVLTRPEFITGTPLAVGDARADGVRLNVGDKVFRP